MYSRLWSNRRLFLNFSSIIHSPKPISNNQNVCVLKGWPHFHVDQWPRWNYDSALWDLEYDYPIGSIQHPSHLNVWFIADWLLVYFDLQFNSDLCMFIWTILTNPDFCKGIFYRQEMWLWTIHPLYCWHFIEVQILIIFNEHQH